MSTLGTKQTDQSETSPKNIAYNLGFIAAIAALIGLGAAYLLDGMSVKSNSEQPKLVTAGPTIEKNVAGVTLAIPPAWFRFSEQRTPGFSDKIDLVFALPLGTDNKITEVEVTLQPSNRARASADILDSVYLHQFTPRQVEGPPGLIGKPLKDKEGYANETVWYDPVSINPFVAKCLAPVSIGEPANCIRTVALNAQVSATYIFDQDLLNQWNRFDDEAAVWFAKIGGARPEE